MHTTHLLKKSFSIIALVFLVLVLLPSGSIRAASLANPLAECDGRVYHPIDLRQ